ncbi:MAG: hypothetical protein CMJ48_07440 [Planctomycetaceae bacterium]|nr:hypothetical protein [Planctomycetaceae bacterium]
MKRNKTQTLRDRKQRARKRSEGRRGSTILIVVAFTAMLFFVGIFFFGFASNEERTSEYYAEAAKIHPPAGSTCFDFALRQIILGAHPTLERQSALSGGRHSLMATAFGRDLQPGSGMGVNVIMVGGVPVIDQDRDGVADVNPGGTAQNLRDYVHAGAGAGAPSNLYGANSPDPDAGVTYPGLDNMYLGYFGKGISAAGAPVEAPIPSYLVPGLLRNVVPPAQWYTSPLTKGRVLRPHTRHMAVAEDGTVSTLPRFISTGPPADRFPFPGLPPALPPVRIGVWTNNGNTVELDADPDNSGVRDAILMDLDYPVQESLDGKKFVPMFAIKIVPANGKVPLNTAGNITGNVRLGNVAQPFGSTDFISQSNEGRGPSEVNPGWVLRLANPGTATGTDLLQHNTFFGRTPASRLELANMEALWLKIGRGEFNGPRSVANMTDLYPGLYGETDRFKNVVSGFPATPSAYPYPGVTGTDDNENLLAGAFHTGASTKNVFPNFVQFPAPIHPIDFRGTGDRVNNVLGGRSVKLTTVRLLRWLAYSQYRLNTNNLAPATAARYYSATGSYRPNLFPPTPTPATSLDKLIDEPEEMNLLQAQSVDAMLGYEENAWLNFSGSDLALTGHSGRIGQLAPFATTTMAGTATTLGAEDIRKRLTSSTWDTKHFGKSFYDPRNPTNFPVPPGARTWEWSADSTGTFVQFPPTVHGAGNNPFRGVLQNLLQMRLFDGTNAYCKIQQRLSINHVLDWDSLDPAKRRVRLRKLTPHATTLGGGVVSSAITHPEQITNTIDQEWLARRDRQLLARDLYVMMYVFCGGNDTKTYHDTSNARSGGFRPLYTATQMRRMAQFVANAMDMMDEDDVITKFEYDKNLFNGWNCDDNAFAALASTEGTPLPDTDSEYDVDHPMDTAEVGVVYGVEGGRRLTLSEGLLMLAKRVKVGAAPPEDHPASEVNDIRHHDYTYVELRNPSPFPVNFNNEAWQIRLVPESADAQTNLAERRLTLKSSAPAVDTGTASLYAIGSAGTREDNPSNPGTPIPSRYRIDPAYDPANPLALQRIAPAGSLKLDLIVPSGNPSAPGSADNYYRINEAPGSPLTNPGDGPEVDTTTDPQYGDFLHWRAVATDPAVKDGFNAGDITVKFELYRRLHLDRAGPVLQRINPTVHMQQSRDNPWVKVDEFKDPADMEVFAFTNKDELGSSFEPKLRRLRSDERAEPWNRSGETWHAQATIANTVGRNNSNSTVSARLWQPHFDRPFASSMELLSIPLYGPHAATEYLGSGTPARLMSDINTAGRVFLNTNQETRTPAEAGGSEGSAGNRWHRLLGFVETPTRMGRHNEDSGVTIDKGRLGNAVDRLPKGGVRVPGRIGVNAIPFPSTLAALIDDRRVLEMDYNQTDANFLQDRMEPLARDWWQRFLWARDGVTTISGVDYILPGSPGAARPFRPLEYNGHGNQSLQHTILRKLPNDSNKRQLFEVGLATEHDSAAVDYVTKHRLLSKIHNNTTTTSHVFDIFIEVRFFEATETTVGGKVFTQVGRDLSALASTDPDYVARKRGFFVVDRSKAFGLLNRTDLPDSVNTYTFNQDFDYQQLVEYGQIIE